MAIIDNRNEGYLNKANKQTESDRDYRGCVNVCGRLFWISGYSRTMTDDDGEDREFIKLVLKRRKDK